MYSKETRRAKQKARVQKHKEIVHNLKRERGCSSCNEKHPMCLEFHHTSNKDFAIGSNLSLSLEKILAEIEKCELLCVNCHRKRHYTY